MSARIHLKISGRVQGVFFRQSALEQAVSLGVHGWVRNRSEGSVELVAEGPRPLLEQLIAWCESGPDLARVESVLVEWDEPIGLNGGFRVRTTV